MKLKSKAPAWDNQSGPNDFIVGVGASAGGMEAIHALFEAMPDNTGFSFVVVQHLSPDYKSLMAELLSRRTAMKVSEAENGMLVKPNCIYVIPSKKNIILSNGRLCLEEKNKSSVPNNSIDIFFESLAKEKKEKAVGIVLSGTGTDGTRGIESIKRNGGIVIVQDPLSAAFDGMPNSASRTGLADLVLPPELIPGELMDFMTDSDLSELLRLSSIIEGIFNSSTYGIAAKKAVRNKQGTIVDFEYLTANRTAERMFGLPHGTITGKTMNQLFPSRDKSYIDRYADVVNTGINARFDFYDETQQRWYETVVVKMLDGVVTTHTDITDKKEAADLIIRNYEDLRSTSMKLIDANQQLERSNFDLLQFASVASHDLKEPLRKIQAFGNVLHSRVKNKLEDGEVGYLNKIINASGRMQTLIEDVLTLSKLSNNEIPYKTVNLNEILRRIAEDLEIVIREKAAELEFDQLPSMEAVPGQMHQLFQNLISNSLKFNNKPNPKIKVSQRKIPAELVIELLIRPEEYFCISVVDNGIGFESQYKDKIFRVFQRLHGRNYEGTGIGLSIARKIVENHKGFIVADGQLNKGATFSIILPKSLLITAVDAKTNGVEYD